VTSTSCSAECAATGTLSSLCLDLSVDDEEGASPESDSGLRLLAVRCWDVDECGSPEDVGSEDRGVLELWETILMSDIPFLPCPGDAPPISGSFLALDQAENPW
jgi:hypothetical protein